MGRRGPPPQPTRLKLLKGNPGRRSLNKREPRPPRQVPTCPRWLNADAKSCWRHTVPLLKLMGVLAQVDGHALTAYCQTFSRWKAAELFLEKHGEVYPIRDERGNVKCMQQLPQVAIARHLLQALRGYQQEFGMTPSARTRVQVNASFEEDLDDEDLFA